MREIEINKIYNENCLDTMARMPDNFIDLTVTSPPYDNLRDYNGYTFDFEPIAQELFRVTKEGGVLVWVVGDATVNGSETLTSFKQAIYFKDVCGFRVHDTMIYEQAGTGAKGSNYSYWQSFEYMFILSKGRPNAVNRIKDVKNTKFGQKRSTINKQKKVGTRSERPGKVCDFWSFRPNVWRYPVGNVGYDKTDHPAPFPEPLCADHIHSWSNESDLIYDPFCGSGTTPKMAHLQKRNWIGSEISSEYVELANKRLKPYLNQLTIF